MRVVRYLLSACLFFAVTAPSWAGFSDPLLARSGSWGQPYADQWGLFAVKAFEAGSVQPYFAPRSLQPVVVALIDTGVDYRHPELPERQFWRNPHERADGLDNDGNGYVDDLIGWDFVNDRQQPWDDHGHGTHVAGIMAAAGDNARGIAGVAPNIRLMVLKALNSAGYGRGSDIAQAIRYAVDQGAQLIHLSLGGQPPGVLEKQALKYARQAGRLVVVAAGNQAEQILDRGYEYAEGVLVIGAVTPDLQRALFSDWGMRLDLVAPGVDILSLRAFGSDFLQRDDEVGYRPGEAFIGRDYYRASGSSFAAPFATAAAAVLLGVRPELKAVELARILRQSAQPLGPKGDDQHFGAGLLNLAGALRQSSQFYINARFTGASWQPQRGLVLYGKADASQFIRAGLALIVESEGGSGNLEQWQPLAVKVLRQRREGPLAVVPEAMLPSRGRFRIRLTVEHASGQQRHSLLHIEQADD
ncbi:MAG: S8 family serine peptidase [Marinobacterium sp.]|nr:S8 family serine peptidase [Marinobacterium sp.]